MAQQTPTNPQTSAYIKVFHEEAAHRGQGTTAMLMVQEILRRSPDIALEDFLKKLEKAIEEFDGTVKHQNLLVKAKNIAIRKTQSS